MKTLHLHGIVLVLFASFASFAFAEEPMNQQATAIGKLGALTDDQRIALLSNLSRDRSDLLAQLLQQLASPTSKHHQCAVVFLLGEYRLGDAVRDLAKIITLEADIKKRNREALWDRYPVAEALIKIGVPAVPAMIENLENAKDEKTRELSAEVIRYIQTRELGKVIVQNAIDKQPQAEKKKNLKEALRYFEEK